MTAHLNQMHHRCRPSQRTTSCESEYGRKNNSVVVVNNNLTSECNRIVISESIESSKEDEQSNQQSFIPSVRHSGWHARSDVVHWVALVVIADVVTELDVLVQVAVHEGDRVVNSDGFGELAVGFKVTRLVGRVLEDDVALGVLVVAQADQDDVSLVDPNFFAQFASDVAQSLAAVEAHGLETAVAKHFCHLRVLLAVFFEHQLTFFRLVFVLSTPSVFSSLSFILRHGYGVVALSVHSTSCSRTTKNIGEVETFTTAVQSFALLERSSWLVGPCRK